MYAFPPMLVPPAEAAGIAIPPDIKNYNPKDFPHWHVFLLAQLGQPMPYATAGWANAKMIAALEVKKLKKMTFNDLVEAGFAVGSSYDYP